MGLKKKSKCYKKKIVTLYLINSKEILNISILATKLVFWPLVVRKGKKKIKTLNLKTEFGENIN